MHSSEIHPGDILAGKYRVRAILGRNHGLLVDAFHTEFDQRVVIKALLPGAGDSKEIERFRREARTLAKLSSEHAARIIDVGSEPDGSFYLVREYLEGTDLGRYLKVNGPLALSDAVLLVLQAAEAVAETHSHGIIVRELQPSTLFLTQRPGGAPLIKIIDFGTAKLMNAAAAPSAGGDLTATAMFGLSPYSSPEMIRKAKSADGRTDVWSLGAILYELLTGRAPFIGEAAMLMLQITREDPTPPSHLAPHLPPDIDQIIAWAMAKDVDARFKNIYAFAHALRPFAPPEGQLLVDRIGQITEQAKRRPKPASLPPPAAPAPRPSQPAPPMSMPAGRHVQDSFTREYVPPARGSQRHAADVSADVEETTSRVGPGMLAAPSPNIPTIPPPRPSQPAPPLPGPGALPSSPPPSGFASTSAPSARGPSSSYSSPELQGSGPNAAYQTQPPRKGLLDKRIMVGGLAAVAVLLPAMVAILVMSRSRPSGPENGAITVPIPTAAATMVAAPEPSAEASASSTASSAASSEAPAATSAAPTAEPAPTASATASASATATQGPVASNPPKAVTGGGGSWSPPAPTPKPTPKPEPKPEPEPAAGGSGPGTLMAVAIGGTCAFSVNGSSKGSGSSIKVTLSPGTYSVMCKPPGGGIKSKSITVKSGATAMATFKL